ncbi:amidohydrolase [Parashewanella spongiae]|uniref:Amidohydrolase n=1 Tax=Parashewanella spongiae TaxID=342950 RepID=A0A3A6TZL9_9GAMM|nr:amidohydrolase family protein [Parashewanella spongiae]MCL1077942.1 amidohydrolase family protein [Parashewanella spongiae]RJY18438.1 amidohydrolase [Parashewanella spongiae]
MITTYVDSHQHFWQLSRGDYAWLTPELPELYRDFLPKELESLIKVSPVAKTILVQAAPTYAETIFLLKLAEENDAVAGVVGWIDMESDSAIAQLNLLINNQYFKGIRPMIQDIKDQDWMLNSTLTPVFEFLSEHNLTFDALVLPKHLKALQQLAIRHPKLNIVIDHAAKPNLKSANLTDWQRDMSALAAQPNVYCKISGLLTEAKIGIRAAELQPVFDFLLKQFSASRLMWGSDWPVLNLVSDYHEWLAMTLACLQKLTPEDRNQIMQQCAAHFYRI